MSLLLGITLLGACTAEPTTTSGAISAASAQASAIRGADAAENQDLATLRAATAGFHRYEVAKDAGYTFLFMNMCMANSQLGGMGYHYVNTNLLDGSVDVAHPEAVMYEPEANGQLRLVGVEYVIPQDKWTSQTPPTLFGKSFKLNAFGLWALHVWAWENNPSGIYADWNPRVTCDNAAP